MKLLQENKELSALIEEELQDVDKEKDLFNQLLFIYDKTKCLYGHKLEMEDFGRLLKRLLDKKANTPILTCLEQEMKHSLKRAV